MQYLIKTITHDTGEVFHDVVKAKENEVFTLVDAESEREAKDNVDDTYSRYTELASLIMLGLWAVACIILFTVNYLL